MAEERGGISVIVVPDGGRESRTWHLSRRRLRFLAWLGGGLGLLLAIAVASWIYLGIRAAEAGRLEAEVQALREDQGRVASLARQLQELERRYDRIRDIFGSSAAADATSPLWLPPPGAGRTSGGSLNDPDRALPTSWPLTASGFVTQPLLEGAGGSHPGIDIAVPSDSYIRAAGTGTVLEAGEDPVYGRYLILDHGNGYRTRYAHASTLFVQEGRRVHRDEVIGLTGSTGRSTAPHLHFEVMRNGAPVDPLSLVRQP